MKEIKDKSNTDILYYKIFWLKDYKFTKASIKI